ncbi:LysR family transcriptional regulator [Paraburkholderia sediminicola]|uniref:LysR family transcriptional regulator n=1 Tax=Paraburkholderia sediminicola TaxID=458836 RepID=UPI0038BD8958
MHQQGQVIDTYLLRVLKTLLDERSVTRAAIQLNQSQPAVSAALRRLRDAIGDPLFVRGKSGVVPTEYALELLEPARRALGEIEKITIQRATFSPSDCVRCFRIGCPDYLSASFMPDMVRILRREAPAASLELVSPGLSFDVESAIEKGAMDLVVGTWPAPPKQLRRAILLSDEVVCLVGDCHPLAKRGGITVEDYEQAAHIAQSPYSAGPQSVIDVHLAKEKLRRKLVIKLPHFNLAPYALVNSDLIFTTTRLFAEHFARLLPLKVLHSPIVFPSVDYHHFWHERSHYPDEVRWLRGILKKAMKRQTVVRLLGRQPGNKGR